MNSLVQRLNNAPGSEYLLKTGIVTIVRGVPEDKAEPLADALYRGGIRVMEVTMNTPGAADMIPNLRAKYGGGMWIGAGTVLSRDDCEAAHAAGAQFFVTPNADESVISYAVEHGLPIFPGATTPTEVVKVWQAGATAVKIFPSRSLGAGYIKELQGPLSHIPMMAVGGVSVANASEYIEAGVKAIGVGGNLVDKDAIAGGDFASIERAAREIVKVVQAQLQK